MDNSINITDGIVELARKALDLHKSTESENQSLKEARTIRKEKIMHWILTGIMFLVFGSGSMEILPKSIEVTPILAFLVVASVGIIIFGISMIIWIIRKQPAVELIQEWLGRLKITQVQENAKEQAQLSPKEEEQAQLTQKKQNPQENQ